MSKKTIRDVARAANVSVATVSRVLNKHETVHPDLCNKVYDAINKLDYVPNLLARGLKTDVTNSIGIIVSDISNYYFIVLAKALECILRPKGYSILFCSTENDHKTEVSCLKTFLSMQIAGLLINTTGYNDAFIAEISQRIPVVLIDREIRHPDFRGDRVGVDDVQIGYNLTSHMIEHGHTKIGVINGSTYVSTGMKRFEGAHRAFAEHNIIVNPEYIFNGDFTFESGYNGAECLMSLPTPPTAIVVMNQNMACGVMSYLRKKDIMVPGDVSIAIYGYMHNLDLLFVKPSIIEVDPTLMGESAIRLLLERISSSNSFSYPLENQVIIYTPPFLPGNSVRDVR